MKCAPRLASAVAEVLTMHRTNRQAAQNSVAVTSTGLVQREPGDRPPLAFFAKIIEKIRESRRDFDFLQGNDVSIHQAQDPANPSRVLVAVRSDAAMNVVSGQGYVLFPCLLG